MEIKKFENFEPEKDMFGNVATQYPEVSDRFWEFVEKVNWKDNGNSSADYILDYISPHFTRDEFKKFKKEYKVLDNFLDHTLNKVWLGEPGIEVSDDGYWDLRSSIIGWGKDFYYDTLKKHYIHDNHDRIRKMGENNEYKENFEYIFQLLDDKEVMRKWKYGKRGK